MKLPLEIEEKLEKLIELGDKYKVKRIFVFGSIVKGTFNPQNSDIDLIVELEDLPPTEKGELLMKLWTELEKLFARRIDLITNTEVKNPYLRKEIEKSKFLLYDRAS